MGPNVDVCRNMSILANKIISTYGGINKISMENIFLNYKNWLETIKDRWAADVAIIDIMKNHKIQTTKPTIPKTPYIQGQPKASAIGSPRTAYRGRRPIRNAILPFIARLFAGDSSLTGIVHKLALVARINIE